MALNRKYANLPDLDSAPDIYETPELTDDISTVPTTAGPSQSDNESGDDDDDATGISKSRLRIDDARSRFLPSNVDTGAVDFSDRVDGKRKSYKTSTRRQRVLEDGTTELGDFSDEETEESFERKIARLQREIEEAKEEHGKRQAAEAQKAGGDADPQSEKLASLSEVLNELSQNTTDGLVSSTAHSLAAAPAPTSAGPLGETTEQGLPRADKATYTVTYAPTYDQSHALAKAADFDRRLVMLEKAIGVNSTALPEVDVNGLPRAILPTLDNLQKQIITLSQASTTNLDSISRRVRTLTTEAQSLEKARQGAKMAQEALGSPQGAAAAAAGASGEDSEDSEQAAKINALYGTLPTIENLAPLLPPLLDRLRSLRVIHSDAASAGDTLDRIEKQQADMTADMKHWREGLDKVEESIKQGDASMSGNMKVMEQWVKDLEGRMAKLS